MAESKKAPQRDPQSKAYRRWYERHREEFNARRRERYQQDKEYRMKAIENTRKSEPVAPEQAPPLPREIDGKIVYTYRPSAAAAMAGRTYRVLRQWELAGWIPATSFPDPQRLYSAGQVKLLRKLANTIDAFRYKHKLRRAAVAKVVDEIWSRWEDAAKE